VPTAFCLTHSCDIEKLMDNTFQNYFKIMAEGSIINSRIFEG